MRSRRCCSSRAAARATRRLPRQRALPGDHVDDCTAARCHAHRCRLRERQSDDTGRRPFHRSLNGHLEEALAVARNPRDAVYPVGTVIQLIPTEAMVKRHKGYSPSTGDWEFFSLNVSPTGTEIQSSGAKVKNFLGGDCASCHVAAKSHFDFVCEKGHGCAPLGVTDELIATIQKGDPRPKR